MKKTLTLTIALLFMSIVSFGQSYLSKQDTKSGKLAVAQQAPKVNSNNTKGVTFFSEDFEGTMSAWTIYDQDADTKTWAQSSATGNFGHTGGRCVQSASWDASGALTPDNWITSSVINLTAGGASTTLDFWRKAQDQSWPSEKYTVYLSTSGNTVADFTGTNGHIIQAEETVIADDWQKRSISLASYVGGNVYIAFRHHNCTNMFILNIDDIEVYENSTVDGAITAFSAPNNATCAKTATEDVTITIFNFGGADLTNFDASYSINGGTAVTETITASIPTASSINYTFTQKADLSVLGYYNFDASISITGDADTTNNTWAVQYIANGDDDITIDVSTDSQGGQSWYVTNIVTGDTIAQHGAYQWDLTNDITTVCLNNADCYNFIWKGGGSNDVVVSHGGVIIDTRTATGDYQLFGIGSGCTVDDVDLTAITTPEMGGIGNINITGTVQNIGTANLTAFDVVYTVDGGTPSATYTATCNIATGQTYDFTHDVAWASTLGSHNIVVTVNNANGNASADVTLNKGILIMNETYPRTVVYEEGTGTWCGWCVRGLVGLNTMAHNVTDGTWIGIGVHNGDPMTVTDYDAALAGFISGYPSGLMNRNITEVDPGLDKLQAAYAAHKAMPAIAKIAITAKTFDETTLAWTIDVATTFGVDITTADYNTALIIVENGVTGSGLGWDQANYYSAGSNPMVDYDGTDYVTLANPVPAADMTYNHVARKLVDGFAGSANSVPTTITYNVANSFSYSGTLDAAWNKNNISFVALLLDNTTGKIVNATEVDLAQVGINTPNTINYNIYPNPTTGIVTIEGTKGAQIVVLNMIGDILYTNENASENTTIDLSSFAAGNYIVKIINNDNVSTQKIILTK